MEQSASPEIKSREVQDKDRLRSAQRQKILYDHFKNPSKLELFTGLIPTDRPSPNTAVDEAGLRHLAEYLGKNTHTVLFDLAATSKNPMELYNIMLNISNLKKVESSYWKFKDSEDHFLKRQLSEHIDVSEEVENQTGANDPNPKHILESFFYFLSEGNVSFEDKKRILSEFSSVKTLMPPISGNEASLKIYGPESSFWSHVDGSWIDPAKLTPKDRTKQSKKTNIVSGIASGGMIGRLKPSEATPQSVEPEGITELIVDKIIADRARGAQLPAPPAAQPALERPATQEGQSFPPDSTPEDLGLPSDTDLSRVGLLSSTGQIKGLRPFALITLKDGGQRRVGFNPYSVAGKILLDNDRTVDPDQIEKFRNQDLKTYKYDTTRDILVRNEPAPKPREMAPISAPDTASDRRTVVASPVPVGSTEAGAIPQPNEQSTQQEDLSQLATTELFHRSDNLSQQFDNKNKKFKQADSYEEKKLLYEEMESIVAQKRAIIRILRERSIAKAQETVQPTTPAARPRDAAPAQAPEATWPLGSSREGWPWPADKPSEAQSVNTPKVDPELERILRNPDQPNKENIIELGTGDKDLVQELNEKLKEQATDNVTFAASPNVLKEYLTSIAQGAAKGGSIEVLKNNAILIKGLQLETEVKGVTVKAIVDIAVRNDRYGNIEATLRDYHSGNLATKFGGALKPFGGPSARGGIEKRLADINNTVKTNLDKQIDPEANPLWRTERVSISGDKVHIGFNRAAQPRPR